MKNALKLLGIIAFVLTIGFSSCDNSGGKSNNNNNNNNSSMPSTNGELTITGLGGQTGYVYAYYLDGWTSSRIGVFAAGDLDLKTGTITGVKIANNQVKLKVWGNDTTNVFSNYTENETIEFDVYIRSSAQTKNFNLTGSKGKVNVTFINGKGTGVFSSN
jgi:hypothetical protein